MRWIVVASFLCACGGASPHPEAGDLARVGVTSPDLATGDASLPNDIAVAPDLASAPPDLAVPADMASSDLAMCLPPGASCLTIVNGMYHLDPSVCCPGPHMTLCAPDVNGLNYHCEIN